MGAFKELNRGLKFELIGIVILILSGLALGKFGSIGNSLAFITELFAGNWGFLIPILAGIYALYMIFKRKQIAFDVRMYGGLLFFLLLLIHSHLELYVDLLGDTGSDFNIVTTTYHALVDSRGTEESIDVGGGLVGAIFLYVSIYLFDVTGTKLVMLGGMLIGILLLTKLTIGDAVMKIKQHMQKLSERIVAYFGNLTSLWGSRESGKENQETEMLDSSFDDDRIDLQSIYPVPIDEHRVIKEKLFQRVESRVELDRLQRAETDRVRQAGGHMQETDIDRIQRTDADGDRQIAATPVTADAESQTAYQEIEQADQNVSVTWETDLPVGGHYQFPSLQLLKNRSSMTKLDANIQANSRKLEATLESFGVMATVIDFSQGPSVTRYELQPAIGVKVSKILNLADDLALALAAKDIRIEAPIPGKAAIGIEVPNTEVSIIGLKEIVGSQEFKKADSKLTIALGKDLSGTSIVADLSKMPHLLVAGSTGSGKSVCVNGIITSILYKASPEEVKFFMIDPKMVELNVYNGIPHLATPVVTDPRQASYLLKKVVQEMERRYKLFADRKARDLERYNFLVQQDAAQGKASGEKLPQIIVIIDELADLMMVAPGEVEDAICRIAQMARAAGIHLLIATQRPSVDVITGIIKANIPSRIAFSVASQMDSRTILDMGGAEKLLGRGDMLFLPVGASKPVRIQGAYISEDEIEEVVNFVKEQKPQGQAYNTELFSLPEEEEVAGEEISEDQDELYEQAVELVVQAGQASVSYLQRKLKVGYARAARLIDSMEEKGVVGAFEGSKPRDVLITKEQLAASKETSQ